MAKRAKPARYAPTQDAIAQELGVSRRTVIDWCKDPKFPPKTKKGWNLDRVSKWATDNGRGPEGCKKPAVGYEGKSPAEIRAHKEWNQGEESRIRKERAEIEQAAELQEIVFAADVLDFQAKTVATVTAVHDTLVDAVDRALPEEFPSDAKTYETNRERVMEICAKLKRDVYAAMQEAF